MPMCALPHVDCSQCLVWLSSHAAAAPCPTPHMLSSHAAAPCPARQVPAQAWRGPQQGDHDHRLLEPPAGGGGAGRTGGAAAAAGVWQVRTGARQTMPVAALALSWLWLRELSPFSLLLP